MAVTATPIFPQAIVNAVQTIAPSDTTAVKTLIAAGTNGTKVESIIVTSTDTTLRDVALWITISATNYLIGTVAIQITAGSVDSVPTPSLLNNNQINGLALDGNGNPYLYLAPGTTLSVSCLTTVTTAKLLTFFAQGGNF